MINNHQEAIYILDQGKECNKKFELSVAYEIDDEKYSSYIQEKYIFPVSEFFLGETLINEENITKAMLFEHTIWDYITGRINLKKLNKYLITEGLVETEE